MISDRQQPVSTYLHQAGSPLPYLAASIVSLASAWVMFSWNQGLEQARSPGNLWSYSTAVLLPYEALPGSNDVWSNRLTLAVAVGAALILLLWIGRIGRNVRGPGFGFSLGLLALPAWFTLPLTIGLENEIDRGYGVFILRTALALMLLIGQYALLRATLLRRVWSASQLPRPGVATLLWLPALVPQAMFLGSGLFTLLAVGEDGSGRSGWTPTSTMVEVGRWADRASGVAILMLLVVVSVRQHEGIAADRAADAAYRGR